jgi:hypothetical protein
MSVVCRKGARGQACAQEPGSMPPVARWPNPDLATGPCYQFYASPHEIPFDDEALFARLWTPTLGRPFCSESRPSCDEDVWR